MSLIVALHGLGGNGRQLAYFSGMHNAAGERTLVVYPDASSPTSKSMLSGWNVGFCCGSGWVNGVDDVGFINELVAKLKEQHNIDNKKIYVVGFSNGAMMAQRLAVELPEVFNGFASVAGSIGTKSHALEPKKPVPAFLMHGNKDKRIPIDGGASPVDKDFAWRSFSDNVSSWEKVNGCTHPVVDESEDIMAVDYGSCRAKTQVVRYKSAGHKWPNWRLANIWHRNPESSQRIAHFFTSLQQGKASQ